MTGYILFNEEEYNLDDYKFAESSKTVVEASLNSTYDYLCTLLPKRLAPNAVTLIGFIISFISGVLYLYYQPVLKGYSPPWVFYFGAIATMLYHICDYLDGKQARRIGASSPLGEIFDHGVDAINLIIIFVSSMAASKFDYDNAKNIFIFSLLIFHSSHLGVYQTGIRVDNNGYIGVLELTLYIAINQIIIGYYGPEKVDTVPLIYGLTYSQLLIGAQYIAEVLSLIAAFKVTFLLQNEIAKNRVGKKDLSFKGRCLRAIPF